METDIAETAKVLIESKKAEEGIFEDETVAFQTTEDTAVEVEEEDGVTILGSTIVLKRFVKMPIEDVGFTNHFIGR